MQCEIRSLGEERRPECSETPAPRPGLVTQVCREWLVHEDNALAQRLQEQEIEVHYGKNRSERRVVREDLQQARNLQQEEDDEATQIQRMYEQMLLDQEATDAEVAMKLQEVERKKLDRLRQTEDDDEEIARQMQEKEKLRFERKKRDKRMEHELQQVENVRTQTSWETDEPVASPSARPQNLRSPLELPAVPHETDLSDFCLKPTPDMEPVAVQKLQEEQDAELARLLQEQETKRSGYSDRDRQLAIEAQDRELARVLQEQERAKARRAKERARLKALQKQAEQASLENGTHSPTQSHASDGDSRHSSLENSRSDSPLSRTATRIPRPTELEVAVTVNHVPSQSVKHSMERHTARTSSQSSTESVEKVPSEHGSSSSHHHPSTNIAMAIDPTYNRRKKTVPTVTSPVASYGAERVESGGSTPVLPSPLSIRTGTYSGDDIYYDSDESPAPPYMPIQGQRRNSSLEKKKKSKSGKDGCKQQ